LFQEYLGNLAYALVLRRLSRGWLAALLVPAGVALIFGGMHYGTLSKGFGWDGYWMAPVRLAFPFIAGLLTYRLVDQLPGWRFGLIPLGAVLAIAFALPVITGAAGGQGQGAAPLSAWNGLFEALLVMLVFPPLILLGAHSGGSAMTNRACKLLGRLSYPLYIIHYPFIYLLWDYAIFGQAAPGALLPALVLTFPVMIVLAVVAMIVWDEPVRRWLARRVARLSDIPGQAVD
jgi:peptidoglycan/LPS O-acetylase OafA/YrhL